MALKDIAKEIREENEFMPAYETVKKDEFVGKQVTIDGYTIYTSKKEMYAKNPKTVIVAVTMDGKKLKAHFHNKEVVEAFARVEKAEDVIGEVITFAKVKVGMYDTIVIQ